MSTVTERSYDAQRKADARADKRDLTIPAPLNVERREACEASTPLWLSTYCPDVFYNPFTFHQRRIIDDCDEVLLYGTQKCKAAQRGGGKSSILKYAALSYSLKRKVRFPLLLSATSTKSKKTLQSLERRLATSATFDPRTRTFRLLNALAEDYPLECCIAAYVDPWPSRARNVTANGGRSINCEWGAEWFVIPTWADEESLGPILLALGITSDELQGCNIYDQRPDFVLLDDLDSRDSLAAQDGVMAGKIEEIIDKTVAGLAGQSRRLGQFMLCTITSRQAAAFKYSDPAQKPAWSGERIPAILKWPERRDLWDQYIALRQAGKSELVDGKPKDVFGREAHALYLAGFEEMNRGSELENEYNFEGGLLPDGTQKQVSALQACFDYIADYGMESFLTEKQNDPPEESGPQTSGITSSLVQSRISGWPRRMVPSTAVCLTAAIDIGKYRCHWVVMAWLPGCVGLVIDYGVLDTTVGAGDDRIATMHAVKNALLHWREFITPPAGDPPYRDEHGEPVKVDLILCDSGDMTDAIYSFVKDVGGSPYVASKGSANNYRRQQSIESKVVASDHWHAHYQGPKSGVWLYLLDTDHWKHQLHDRFLTPAINDDRTFRRGSLSLWEPHKDHKNEHHSYSKHIVAEEFREEFIEGKGLKRAWHPVHANNHWLDASYMAIAAADMLGVKLLPQSLPTQRDTSPAPPIERFTTPGGVPFLVTER